MNTYRTLTNIGLSQTAVKVYATLAQNGALNAKELAERLSTPLTGLYRVLEKLIAYGFIIELQAHPKMVQALPLEQALRNYFLYQEKAVAPLLQQPIITTQQGTMKVLNGRDQIFAAYAELANQAQKDLLTISLGEEVPEYLYEVAATANSRSVKQYLIFQLHNKQNDRWLKRWLSHGCHVRILPGTGYHLNIIDTRYAILSSSNTQNSLERSAVLIESAAIVLELRRYFFSQWERAQKLSLATMNATN